MQCIAWLAAAAFVSFTLLQRAISIPVCNKAWERGCSWSLSPRPTSCSATYIFFKIYIWEIQGYFFDFAFYLENFKICIYTVSHSFLLNKYSVNVISFALLVLCELHLSVSCMKSWLSAFGECPTILIYSILVFNITIYELPYTITLLPTSYPSFIHSTSHLHPMSPP